MSRVQRLLRLLLCATVAVGVLLPATVARAEPSPQELEQQIEDAHGQLEKIVEDSNRINEELKATQAAAAALNAQMAPLQGQLDAAQAGIAKLAATAYKSGGGLADAGLLLSAGSSATVVHQVESMDRIARSRKREITSYADSREKFQREKKRLDDLAAAQTQAQKQLADRRVTIEAELKRLEDMERRLQAASPTRTKATPVTPAAPPPSGSGKGAVAVRFAHTQLGKMYEWGAGGPGTYDCSGLTSAAWRAAGTSLPHNAAMQYRQTTKVSRAALQPGDLVYYRDLGHVGIYIGNNQIIHASRTGKPVAVAKIDVMPPMGYTRPG